MRVPLGDRKRGVAEDLLDHADVDALLEEQRCRGMPGVVKPRVTYTCLLEQGFPRLPVVPRRDRTAIGPGEDEVPVLPQLSRRQTLRRLRGLVRPQQGDQR